MEHAFVLQSIVPVLLCWELLACLPQDHTNSSEAFVFHFTPIWKGLPYQAWSTSLEAPHHAQWPGHV
jgi:hypothetical protein